MYYFERLKNFKIIEQRICVKFLNHSIKYRIIHLNTNNKYCIAGRDKLEGMGALVKIGSQMLNGNARQYGEESR